MNKEKITKIETIFETSYEDAGDLPTFIESCKNQAISLISINLMSLDEAADALAVLKEMVVDHERESVEIARQAKLMINQVQLAQKEVSLFSIKGLSNAH